MGRSDEFSRFCLRVGDMSERISTDADMPLGRQRARFSPVPGGRFMRKAISSVAVGVALTALLSTSVVVAVSASAASSTCNAVDAPKAMNDLPASADCPTPGSSGGLHAHALAPAVTL